MENTALLTLCAAFAGLLMSGVSVAFFAGRRRGQAASIELGPVVMERVEQSLDECLDLRDALVRDWRSLQTALALQPGLVTPPVAAAIEQLRQTAALLVEQFPRQSGSSPPELALPPLPALLIPSPPPTEDSSASPSAQSLALSAARPPVFRPEKVPASPFADGRRFRRLSFQGSARATIYPRQADAGTDPVQCDVLTRDLSCGGIGIAHCQPLYPKQIIVLDAVGKLLVGEIRWCRRIDEQFYVAGCRLVKTNT